MLNILVYISMVPVAAFLLGVLIMAFRNRSSSINAAQAIIMLVPAVYLISAFIWVQNRQDKEERAEQARAAAKQAYEALYEAECGSLAHYQVYTYADGRESINASEKAALLERLQQCENKVLSKKSAIFAEHGLDRNGDLLPEPIPTKSAQPEKPKVPEEAPTKTSTATVGSAGPEPQKPPAVSIDPASASYEIQRTAIDDLAKDIALKNFALSEGKTHFEKSCVGCHGAGAVGRQGVPNLTDSEWIWGGKLADIEQTIRYGVRNQHAYSRQSEMPLFGVEKLLTPEQINTVANYVLSLSQEAPATTEGRTIFIDNCGACHGEGGEGSTDMGAPPLNNKAWLYSGTKEGITAQITAPQLGTCPAWVELLDEVAIKELAVYVHSLSVSQKQPAAGQPAQIRQGASPTNQDRCSAYFDLANKPLSEGGCRGAVPDDWLQRGWTLNDMTNALNQCFSSHGVSQSDADWCSMSDPRSAGYKALHGR